MQIFTRYYGFLTEVTGKLHEELQLERGTTLEDLVQWMVQLYGNEFKAITFFKPLYSKKDYANIYLNCQDINDRSRFPQGLKVLLQDGDRVSFGPLSGSA